MKKFSPPILRAGCGGNSQHQFQDIMISGKLRGKKFWVTLSGQKFQVITIWSKLRAKMFAFPFRRLGLSENISVSPFLVG